jgi:hypothetical protein
VNFRKHDGTSPPVKAGYFAHALGAAALAALAAGHGAQAREAALNALPLSFERNVGQAPQEVQYLAHGASYAIALTREGAALSLAGSGEPGSVVALTVQGASAAPAPTAARPLPGHFNYFIGNDPAQWRTDVATFGQVRYQGVYPGIDLVYYGTQGRLEYDFTVAPGASPHAIGLRFAGGEAPLLGARGELTIAAGEHAMTFEPPVAYQVVDGHRRAVSARYRLEGAVVGFALGHYDHALALVIDPVLSYLTYLGGSKDDVVGNVVPSNIGGGIPPSQALAVDASNNAYVVGYTSSTDFPTHAPFAPVKAKTSGSRWAFVTKISADASSLVYSTYLGGSNGDDFGYGIALDAQGNAFVTGATGSNDFPATSGAYQTLCAPNYTNSPGHPFAACGPSGGTSAFVSKLSPTGALLGSTFLGGTAAGTAGAAVAVDAVGRPYVVGTTYPGETIPAGVGGFNQQAGFPVTAGALVAPYQYAAGVNLNGQLQDDMFISVFSADLKTLVYSTLIGDTQAVTASNPLRNQADTVGAAIALDASGNIYVGARTEDAYVPTTAGALQPQISSCGATFPNQTVLNGRCGYLAKLSPVGGASPPTLLYGTYLGAVVPGASSQAIEITSLVVDASGDLYVLGSDSEAGFPTTAGAFQRTCNGYDGTTNLDSNCAAAFLAKLNPQGSALLASTYFGCLTCNGDAVYIVAGIALDASGNVYFSGIAADQLQLVNAFPKAQDAGGVAPFIVEMDGGLKTVKVATLLNAGGAGQIVPSGLALDSTGRVYVAGSTNVLLSPAATPGALQGAYGGGSSDGFIARVSLAKVSAATATTLTVAPASANTGTSVSFTATVTETSGSAAPTGTVKFMNGSNTLGSADLNSSGVASFASATLAAGSYSVTAAYQGDSDNAASSSAAVALSLTTPAPPAPTVTISVSPASITVGASATVTWSSTNATGCTASSAWSGSQATSGTLSVSPTSAGAASYALACTGGGGTANGTATLTVNAASGGGGSTTPPASGGGGGAVDPFTVLGLIGIAALSLTRRARRSS